MADCAQDRKVQFFRVTGLRTMLVKPKEERSLWLLRHQRARFDLLILDETD